MMWKDCSEPIAGSTANHAQCVMPDIFSRLIPSCLFIILPFICAFNTTSISGLVLRIHISISSTKPEKGHAILLVLVWHLGISHFSHQCDVASLHPFYKKIRCSCPIRSPPWYLDHMNSSILLDWQLGLKVLPLN